MGRLQIDTARRKDDRLTGYRSAAGMASSATLPGYPPTPITAGAQPPPSALFSIGASDLGSSRGFQSGRANVPAGLADMEARVAGMFPNNPRPFGIIHSDTPWLGDRFAAGPSSAPLAAAAIPGQNEPATSSPLNGKPTDRAGDQPRSGRAGNRRKQKFTRTRTGCLTCRARRIKCDEGLPVCKRCIIAKKEVSPSRNQAMTRGADDCSASGHQTTGRDATARAKWTHLGVSRPKRRTTTRTRYTPDPARPSAIHQARESDARDCGAVRAEQPQVQASGGGRISVRRESGCRHALHGRRPHQPERHQL